MDFYADSNTILQQGLPGSEGLIGDPGLHVSVDTLYFVVVSAVKLPQGAQLDR